MHEEILPGIDRQPAGLLGAQMAARRQRADWPPLMDTSQKPEAETGDVRCVRVVRSPDTAKPAENAELSVLGWASTGAQ